MQRLPARNFQDLIVWQKAHKFVLSVYRITKAFPREEIYGLTSQFRRSAVSSQPTSLKDLRKRGVQIRRDL